MGWVIFAGRLELLRYAGTLYLLNLSMGFITCSYDGYLPTTIKKEEKKKEI